MFPNHTLLVYVIIGKTRIIGNHKPKLTIDKCWLPSAQATCATPSVHISAASVQQQQQPGSAVPAVPGGVSNSIAKQLLV